MSVADILRRTRPGAIPNSLFDQVGGRPALDRVHKCFYDKVYKHIWLSQYFDGVEQATIETHQSDFMTTVMGGGQIFCGRPPKLAHIHVEVSAELFDIRHELLRESLIECRVDPTHREAWLKIDAAFKHTLVRSLDKCRPSKNTISSNDGDIISIPRPPGLRPPTTKTG